MATDFPVRVLGIDPGTLVCGWGVVLREGSALRAEGYGVVRAPRDAPIEARLAVVLRGLSEVVARFRPTEGAIEEVFAGRDVRAAVRIGEGRGAALLALSLAGLPVAGYANNVVKRAVAGAGRADKERVRTMVRAILRLGEITGPLDASDALALAICHHHRRAAPGEGAPRPLSPRATGASPAGRLAPRVEAAVRAMRAAEAARGRAPAGGGAAVSERLRLSPDASVARLQGEAVVLHLPTGSYFSVNATGAALLDRLKDGATREQLVDGLVASFGAPREAATVDVAAWLDRLEASALLVREGDAAPRGDAGR